MAARRTPEQAKAAFLALVAEHGGELADGAAYRNTRTPVDLVCPEGHACAPHPFQLLAGGALCGICARQGEAIAAFLARVAELGAELADGAEYRNNQTPVDLICAKRHACNPRPSNVMQGHGICLVCSGQDQASAEARFWARVRAHGAKPAPGAVYVNRQTPVDLICAKGHPCSPWPSNVRQGICVVCSGRHSATAQAAFWARVDELGARPDEGVVYMDAMTPVALICAAGHRCCPTPAAVNFGHGICQQCVVVFDRVYLLVHPVADAIKVGIASGKTRVRKHFRGGYRLVAQWTGLDHDDAVATERAVLRRWREAGIKPVTDAPADGRTETAPARHLEAARAQLQPLLGAPDAERDADPGPDTVAA